MATLQEAVNQVQTRIERYKGLPINEQNTKASLIEPILRALGWDTEDFEEVHREFKPKSADNPVDYALFIMGTPRLFIEAKALGQDLNDRRWANQIMGYASVAGVEWIVLTDGNEYRIYNSHATVPIEEKRFRTIRIGDDAVITEETLSLLSKESVQRDDIGALWQAYFVDWKVRTTLEQLFAPDPDPSLVRLIAGRVRNLTNSEIRASLNRAHARFDFPAESESIPKHVSRGLHRSPGIPVVTIEPATIPGDVPQRAVSPREPRRVAPAHTKQWFGVSLTELVGANLIKLPLALEHVRNGHRLVAQLEADGTITWQGTTYRSPSAAGGIALTSLIGPKRRGGPRAVDGWEFWFFRDHDGQIKPLDSLRQRYLAAKKDGMPDHAT